MLAGIVHQSGIQCSLHYEIEMNHLERHAYVTASGLDKTDLLREHIPYSGIHLANHNTKQ